MNRNNDRTTKPAAGNLGVPLLAEAIAHLATTD